MPSISSTPFPSVREYVELQVDYWNLINKSESTDKGDKSSKKDSNKVSLKSAFKSIHVSRLASGLPAHFSVDNQTVPFTLTVVTREKKQKSEYFIDEKQFNRRKNSDKLFVCVTALLKFAKKKP